MGKKKQRKAGWGGVRPNSGAKPRYGEVAGKSFPVYLYPDHIAAIKRCAATLGVTQNEAVRTAIVELDERLIREMAKRPRTKRPPRSSPG